MHGHGGDDGAQTAADPQNFADPERIQGEVADLLDQLHVPSADAQTLEQDQIPHQARVLEQAHDVLVRALATVDKI
ncbi:hypothetical protein FOY51_26690 [Antrihabitans cavernicola]|uniref:Uncharacterized protein n=1 Tax=Antrihabitans cavernicola TaxID=2495913 RepID=A0A5A7S3F8_9NOCA|nr:hypothetical protein FOY51_26690 [Spelaeibacter cavernicola]